MSNDSEPVAIRVDCADPANDLPHIWTSIGFDEINWSYAPRGQKLLAMLKDEVIEQPYYVRNHNAFTSGNSLSYPAGGSTNVYREDENGNAIYNWETVDKIYDAYVANNCHPLIELGFLPFDLVPNDEANFTGFGPAFDLGKEPYESGKWKLPPKDFVKWEKLVEAFVGHLVERYGADEVANWYFELWNEPDIPNYWLGTVQDYCRLYDHSVAGATRAFAQVKIGGPATTDRGSDFLRHFLNHCLNERNSVTGTTGTQLDFVSFHTKGAYYTPRRSYSHPVKTESPSLTKMLGDIQRNLAVIAEFPQLQNLPIFVDECDPAVGTIYGVYDNPNFVVCNSEYYPSFVAAMVGQILQLNQTMPVAVGLITHWAFYMEGKRFFEGNRTLVTNENVANPFVAGLKMLAKLGRNRLKLSSTATIDVLAANYSAQTAIIDGLATLDGDKIAALIWHHVDDWTVKGSQDIRLTFANLPFEASQVVVRHYRLDHEHSNTYTKWLALGKPEAPTAEQLAELKAQEELALATEVTVKPVNKTVNLAFSLPTHGLSLIEISPS